VGDRLSAVPAAIADEIVGGRCTHRPPAGASFPCFDCSFGCYNPRNCSQSADTPAAADSGGRPDRLARAVGIRRRPVRLGPAPGWLRAPPPCG